MSDVVVYKAEDGKLAGMSEKGQRALAKFDKLIAELAYGDTLHFSYRLPRCPVHHRGFFWALRNLFDRQEQFSDPERLLEWLKVGAGHVDLMPGRDGIPVAIPKSINWQTLGEQEFIEFSRAMNDFLWTPHAQQFLWPHLDNAGRDKMISDWHTENSVRR